MHPIQPFLDDLAAATATPGGGGAAAATGAMGAALVSMVCNLTIGKKRYVEVEAEMTALLAEAEELRQRLRSLVDADAEAFEQVMQAMQMSRETEADKQARTEALQAALKAAAQAPMQVAEASRAVMELCPPAVAKGNANVVSDAGVAVLMAEAALRGAALNVLINLKWIKDEAFVKEQQVRLDGLLDQSTVRRDEIYASVLDAL